MLSYAYVKYAAVTNICQLPGNIVKYTNPPPSVVVLYHNARSIFFITPSSKISIMALAPSSAYSSEIFVTQCHLSRFFSLPFHKFRNAIGECSLQAN